MQGLWYGDKRDRVKWGALVHLANTKGIRCIVQVAYFRHGTNLKLQINECDVEREVDLHQEVWDHFSDLRHIERLGGATGLEIIVLDKTFDPAKRPDYIGKIIYKVNEIKSRKIVFLDPDTGIAPRKGKAEHITTNDLQKIWGALLAGDLLVIYQHAAFAENWLNDQKKKMSVVCDNVCVKHILGKGIAQDMAMLWCLKDSAVKSVTDSESIIEREPSTKTTEAALKAGKCPCGCEGKPNTKKGIFVPGHDGRISGWIRQIEREEKEIADFPAINDLYAAWLHAGKPGENHPRLAAICRKLKK
jgi:hypothetical protein